MNKLTQRVRSLKGFTLIELLLVIAIIAILAAIVIIAINPARQLAQANDAQRRSHVTTILNAVGQYTVDNRGQLPATIPTSTGAGDYGDEICATGAAACTGYVDLSVLTNEEIYVGSIPSDPTAGTANGTGYYIVRSTSTNARVTVSGNGEIDGTANSISVTR
ncbi:prepilin-type N-terminal cleavage/methylation domain-containing protein [Patescibacteria group bacterium]|nr:prepilin-type N-terminal cleavage/methylation domain-containing protein [Patescibacteria group bacterium]MBU1448327.1 prepilin-type N-terminal cleavage/methylation domain-containing protein [Patescibacteria group bacterium]MBU2612861.1 prepilin-type N-terminal cleavage/methylation domain-containing protein [Patescibacteria group bacterium]